MVVFLFAMMKQWNVEQREYALNNGLRTFIKNAKFFEYINDRVQSMISGLYWNCIIYLQRLDRKNGTKMKLEFKGKMRNTLSVHVMRHTLRDTLARDLILSTPMGRKVCGEWHCFRDSKYICKGCRLIRYCCRKHQKIHWKQIHSQQCYRK